MDHRKLATALSELPKDQVDALLKASNAIREAETALGKLAPVVVKQRKKRGPNKPKLMAEPVALPAAKKSHHKQPVSKPLSSALDRLKAVKGGGIKSRRVPVDQEDED